MENTDCDFLKYNLYIGSNFKLKSMIIIILYLAIIIVAIAAQWKVFEKAGQPGWACLIPIYNIYIMTQIGKKPGWWVLMLLVPIANIVFAIMIIHSISEKFGKDAGFTVGLVLLGIVFWPILAFGDATYEDAEPATDPEIIDN